MRPSDSAAVLLAERVTSRASRLDAFNDGVERRIDVGHVDGRMFLNNVSLGICGDAV